jgi:hypothetical protein
MMILLSPRGLIHRADRRGSVEREIAGSPRRITRFFRIFERAIPFLISILEEGRTETRGGLSGWTRDRPGACCAPSSVLAFTS